MDAAAMAKLFDVIEVKEVVDASDASDRSFDERCEDVKDMMIEEEVTKKLDSDSGNEHREIIAAALEEAESSSSPSQEVEVEVDTESQDSLLVEGGEQYESEVSRDMAEFEFKDGEEDQKGVKTEDGDNLPLISDPLDIVEEDEVFTKDSGDNPLGLRGYELQFYRECLKKYPQFTLYDGSVSFKEFYRYKVHMLNMVLTKYPVLDTADIRDEIAKLNTDHFLGEKTVITPNVIRYKIDESYKWRARLSAIILRVIPQFYIWERWGELLESKLWKDHDLKGAHRRHGLTMEHMSDVADYIGELKGVMESGKHADNILKAASESLSRQLSCLQMGKEALGTTQEGEERVKEQQVSDLDGFDSIGPGEKISAPQGQGVVTSTFGVEADDLAALG